MDSKKIAIVCDGKEISYGFNLLHLFQYKNEKENFTSNLIDDLSIELYSEAAFRHTNISKKTTKVYIGSVKNMDASYLRIFSKYGMAIYQSEMNYILKVNDKQLTGKEYSKFIAYANLNRKEYCALEQGYINRVETLDLNWIAKEFEEVSSGLLGKRNAKVQQQYDCLAFVMYLYVLKKCKWGH